MKRNAAIELLRILLMFGICLCHSIGAGGHMVEPLRNICMMCTVGFIFITGWFGTRLTAMRIVKLLGIAFFAWIVVLAEGWFLHGKLPTSIFGQWTQWWFLNAYLMLLFLSPILNCIVECLTSNNARVRRDAGITVLLSAFVLYGLCWPMHCGWIPTRRIFLTIGHPCQFGVMCVVYLVARTLNVTGLLDKMSKWTPLVMLVTSCGFAMMTNKFTFYNSPFDLLFSIALFYFCKRISIAEGRVSKAVLWVAPSMFFVYLYHSHQDPGFVLLSGFQCWMVDAGLWIPLAWLLTALVIFCVGLTLDAVRRIVLKVVCK